NVWPKKGRVLIPAGEYRVLPLFLKSHVYSEVYFDGKLIHREKVNVLEYSKRNNKIKEFLIFSR
ncbi:MAG: hypothetical protein IJ966_03895, partial [Bacilli bacterium]|nr:hypothetical protein [Bacilli bacterium]